MHGGRLGLWRRCAGALSGGGTHVFDWGGPARVLYLLLCLTDRPADKDTGERVEFSGDLF